MFCLHDMPLLTELDCWLMRWSYKHPRSYGAKNILWVDDCLLNFYLVPSLVFARVNIYDAVTNVQSGRKRRFII